MTAPAFYGRNRAGRVKGGKRSAWQITPEHAYGRQQRMVTELGLSPTSSARLQPHTAKPELDVEAAVEELLRGPRQD